MAVSAGRSVRKPKGGQGARTVCQNVGTWVRMKGILAAKTSGTASAVAEGWGCGHTPRS